MIRSRWMRPPATWKAKKPNAHKMSRITAIVRSMGRSSWLEFGTKP
jgi:hypothetical protein